MKKQPRIAAFAERPNLRQTMQERVRTHLRERIVRGEFNRGEQLKEERLRTELGVGTIPLREALGRLEADGLLEYRSYCGFRVRQFTLQDIREIYELRMGLERLAIDLLAEQDIEPLLERLRYSLDVIDASPREMSNTARNEQELIFHGAIVAATGNRLLSKVFEVNGLHWMFMMNVRTKRPPGKSPDTDKRPVPSHREIYEALEARNFARAQTLVAGHIRKALQHTLVNWAAVVVVDAGDTVEVG